VLHKCANPACFVPFRQLSKGKLFLVETEPLVGSGTRRTPWKGQLRHIEYYWLCDQCALGLTLSYEKERGVVVVPCPEVANKRPTATTTTRELPSNEISRTEQSA